MKKFLLITISAVLLVLGALVAIPFLYKDKIVGIVKNQVNNNVNAVINFDDNIGLSLLKSFPNFSLEINNISVVGLHQFEGDTLLSLKSFDATLDVMSVIKGEKINIIRIVLDEPRVHAIVDKSGKANWDIAKSSTDTATTPTDTSTAVFSIGLKLFQIKNGYVFYDDKQGNMSAELVGMQHTLEGDFSQDNFLLKILLNTDQLTYAMGGVPYLNKTKLALKADIDADMKSMKFTFKENEIALNELLFGFNGWIEMPTDDIKMDLSYEANKAEFKHFLSLVPGIYTKDFATIKSSGKLSFNGFAKGVYNEKSLPAFAFNLNIEDATFQYPELPAPVKNIQIKFAATNPDGNLDNTKADLSKFHFEILNDPFDAKLLATNVMKDPQIDATFNGKINFDNIMQIVPLEEGMKISGLMQMNIIAKGVLSTIENEQYEKFDAKGNFSLSKFMYTSNDLPKPYKIETAVLNFNPKTVSLTALKATLGNTDMNVSGELSNFFAYSLGDGTLKGVLNFNSTQIDANEFLSEGDSTAATSTTDTASIVAPEIPDNIDFTLNAKIAKLLYTNMEIDNFMGQVVVSKSKLSFNKVSLNTIGSTIKMQGFYETTNPKKPTTEMTFTISDMSFNKSFQTFNTIQKLAPIAEKMTGNFSTKFSMRTMLDNHLNPVYDSLYAIGNLTIPEAGLKDVKLFNLLSDELKYAQLKDPALRNTNIDFEVKNGRVYTEPFDMEVAEQMLTLSGSSGLDQTIDYKGKAIIPRSALGTANNAASALLEEANAKAGTKVKLSETIPVVLGIGGTFTKPIITTNLADILKDEANSIKDQLLSDATKKARELEAKARAEADKLRKDAETKVRAEADKAKAEAMRIKAEQEARAKAEIDKAKAEAERIKKEQEARAQAEKERLKKQAEEEAKKKLKGLFGK